MRPRSAASDKMVIDVTYTRSHSATKPNIAANATSPSTIIPDQHDVYHAPCLLPNHHTRPTSAVFWCVAQIVGPRPGEELLVRPVAAELAAHRKPSANLYSSVAVDFLQHLIDAAEQPFVIEPLVTDRDRRRRRDLVARIHADALQRERIVGLVHFVGDVVHVEPEAELRGRR